MAVACPLISSLVLNLDRISRDNLSQMLRFETIKYNAKVSVTAVVSAPAILVISKLNRVFYNKVSAFDTSSLKVNWSPVSGSLALCNIPIIVFFSLDASRLRHFWTALRENYHQLYRRCLPQNIDNAFVSLFWVLALLSIIAPTKERQRTKSQSYIE